MEALNQQLAAEGAPVMRMRLGVHSGMVLAGSIGSSERLEYAISGDTVKFASRIESLEKDRHDGLHGQRWGDLQVKGRLEPLETWELRNLLKLGRVLRRRRWSVRRRPPGRAAADQGPVRCVACADREIEVEEDRQPRAIAGALTINGALRSTLACWNWRSFWRLG